MAITAKPHGHFLAGEAGELAGVSGTTVGQWARWRTREQNDRIIESSLVFGVYEDGRQVAHARVVTDTVVFGYLGDVFVVPETPASSPASPARKCPCGLAVMATPQDMPDQRRLCIHLRTSSSGAKPYCS